MMKKYLIPSIVAVIIIATLAGCKHKGPASTAVGATAPDFALTSLDGQKYRLSSMRGKVVLVEFWATWCPPCQASVGELNKIAAAYADKDFVLLAVSVDEGSDAEARLEEFTRQKNVLYPVLRDTNGTADVYGVSSIPSLFLVDKDGVIKSHHMGFSPHLAEQISAEIDNLLRQG